MGIERKTRKKHNKDSALPSPRIPKSLNSKSLDSFESPDIPENIPTLLSHASIQDALLQSYRQIHLFIQSILFAVAAGIAVASIFKPILSVPVIILAFVSLIIRRCFQGIAIHRGNCVSHFHRRIILTEHLLPPEQRALTRLKLYQQEIAEDDEIAGKLLGEDYTRNAQQFEEDVSRLVSGGFGHTRTPLDSAVYQSFILAWLGIGFIILVALGII